MSAQEFSSDDVLIPTREQILNCSIANWYPKFRQVTIKTELIPLPAAFVDYLHADGLVLPKGVRAPAHQRRDDDFEIEDDDDDSAGKEDPWVREWKVRHAASSSPECSEAGESNVDEDDDDNDNDSNALADTDEEVNAPEFPELIQEIESKIESLGGSVFPKLNWSAPRDACWIACNESLECKSTADVITLLKSSDFIAHDLSHAFDACIASPSHPDSSTSSSSSSTSPPPNSMSFVLALRKWSTLFPSREFRCFVVGHEIAGISQRDHTNHYEHLTQAGALQSIEDVIEDFFVENIQFNFPDRNYIFDVYVDKRFRVYLIDFNPFARVTDALLFPSLDEAFAPLLRADRTAAAEGRVSTQPGQERDFEFRIVTSPQAAKPSSLMMYRMPKDMLDLSNNRQEELEQIMERLAASSSSSSAK